MPKTILQKNSPILRKLSKKIEEREIISLKIKKIISEMKTALESQHDGVAIAAPQIGYSLRIFIISKRAFEINKKANEKQFADMVFINPVIKKLSKKLNILEEGCLSVRYSYGKVKRSKQATVEAYDENGNKFVRGATGLFAQIFQHEIDHLDGVLFIDKAENIEEIPPEEIGKKIKKQNDE
ncbi:MAG: peptide deformylase [Minisyncoccia bacterium]